MDELPLEIVSHIAHFLDVKDAKLLGLTSWKFYWCTLDRIWNYPKLRLLSVRDLVRELRHLPIRGLNSSDLVEFYERDHATVVSVLNELKTVKSLTLNHYQALNDLELTTILGLNCHIYLYTPVVMNWTLENVMKLKDRKDNIELHFMIFLCKRWSLGELNTLQGIPIHHIDTSIFSLFDDTSYKYRCSATTGEFIETLQLLKPRNIHLREKGYCFISFTRMDLLKMRGLNIKSISTSFLSDYFGPVQPWEELLHLQCLEIIRIEYKTCISFRLLRMFPIAYIVAEYGDLQLAIHGSLEGTLGFMRKIGITRKRHGVYKLYNSIKLYLRNIPTDDMVHVLVG